MFAHPDPEQKRTPILKVSNYLSYEFITLFRTDNTCLVGDVDASTKVVEASVRSNDEINILTCGGAKNIQP